MSKQKIILGSTSPRRRDLLAEHFNLEIVGADIDESPKSGERPLKYVRRMAREKWGALERRLILKRQNQILLTADTTVAIKQKIFGKARNVQEARQMLLAYPSKTHRVITAVALGMIGQKRDPKIISVSTRVRFRTLSSRELTGYLRSGEWKDKAGAYGIQGTAANFVDRIEGSLTNVVGLPLAECLSAISRPPFSGL